MKITVNGQEFETIRGKTFLDVLNERGVAIAHECDGKCTCGTCVVQIIRGAPNLSPMKEQERFHLEAKGAEPGHRLACQSVILGEVEVSTP